MTNRSTFPSPVPVASALAFALALAGCGASDPAPVTQSMSRSAASVSTATTIIVTEEQRYANALHHLYIAYFGRPAEPMGLQFWSRQLHLAQAPTDPAALAAHYRAIGQERSIFDAFSVSQESRALYPGDTAQFVDGVYRNLFNRGADTLGGAYWTNAIERGIITRADAALMIMLGARNDDAIGVRNKIAVSHTFYRILSERTQSVLAYTGNRNNEIARRMIAMVDARTDLVAFEAVIRATIEQMELGVFGQAAARP